MNIIDFSIMNFRYFITMKIDKHTNSIIYELKLMLVIFYYTIKIISICDFL